MSIHFLRGSAQTPRGHAIFIARSSRNANVIYSTYCLVPPIPMSLAKYLPPLFAAQIPTEELQGAGSVSGMPIPPMLEEGLSLAELEALAERRDDDLCDIGTISNEDVERMQMASLSCQEYAQLYATYNSQAPSISPRTSSSQEKTPVLNDLDADELLIEAMSERQKLAELGKLVGTARYALDGHDISALQDARKRMERISRRLPDKYRSSELITAATGQSMQSARLAELYLSRAYKLLDEEYADVPNLDRAIRELQEQG